MINITLLEDIIRDLYVEEKETLAYVSLEPVERYYLTNSPAYYEHRFAKIYIGQVKPKTKPTMRPRCRSFLLASGNANPVDDRLGH